MSVPRVKICGIRSQKDLRLAVEAGADAVGLLCDVPVDSPREIDRETAQSLAAETPPFVSAVLVTMSQSLPDIQDLITAVNPDVVQIHGSLSAAEITELAGMVPVIHALDSAAGDAIEQSAAVADAILLDSTDASGAGGTGETHDWEEARTWVESLDVPIILAGGLTPSNVAAAVKTVKPFGVDVASGVEGPAGKDPTAVTSFVRAATDAPSEVVVE